MTGKPVLEVVEVYRQTVLKRYLCMLPTGVYIEPQGLREGDDVDNPFEDTEKNRVDLRKAAMDFLLSRSGSENARLACSQKWKSTSHTFVHICSATITT